MRDIKACINILSSRTKCLPVSLKSFQEKWNYKYDYPVYVHYFDDIYDDPKLRKAIVEFTGAHQNYQNLRCSIIEKIYGM